MTIKTKKVLLWCGFFALAICCMARAYLPLMEGAKKTDSIYFSLPLIAWITWEWYKNARAYRIFVIERYRVGSVHGALFIDKLLMPGKYITDLGSYLCTIYRDAILNHVNYQPLEAIGKLHHEIMHFCGVINEKDSEMVTRRDNAMLSFYDAVNSLGDDQYFFDLIKKYFDKMPHPETFTYMGMSAICCANQHLNVKFKGGEDFRKLIEPYIEVKFNGTIYSIVKKAQITKKKEKAVESVG